MVMLVDNRKNLLGIDPGRSKCGLAVLDMKKNLLYKNIVNTALISSYLLDLDNKYNISDIVLGDGTFAAEIKQKIKKVFNYPIYFVDEAYTTIQAEERYRAENYRGWKRCLGFIKWKPSCPVDDYVAVILVERYLNKKGQVQA